MQYHDDADGLQLHLPFTFLDQVFYVIDTTLEQG
jgi:hypothetical protein